MEQNTVLSASEKAILVGISVTIFIHLILWMVMDSIRLNSNQESLPQIRILLEQKDESTNKSNQEELTHQNQLETFQSNKASNRDEAVPTNRLDNFRKKVSSLKAMDKRDFFAKNKIQEKEIPPEDTVGDEVQEWLGKRGKNNRSFTGESRVNYELKTRVARSLPVPVYTCERAGRVWVDIWVDKVGRVLKATLNRSRSSLTTVCAKETAIRYAKSSRFNLGKEEMQKGYISYEFIAQ